MSDKQVIEEKLLEKTLKVREEDLRVSLLEIDQKINLTTAQLNELRVTKMEIIGRLKELQNMRGLMGEKNDSKKSKRPDSDS